MSNYRCQVLLFRQTCTTSIHGNVTGDIVFELSQSNSRGIVLYKFAEKEEFDICDWTWWLGALSFRSSSRMATSVYVVGLNNHREFGINTAASRIFTKIEHFDPTSPISRIYCGAKYTIYTDDHHRKIWYAGHKDARFPIESTQQDPIHEMDWFEQKGIHIRRIYTNLYGLCTFWLTSDWKLYATGPIVDKLQISPSTKSIKSQSRSQSLCPQLNESTVHTMLIDGIKNVIDIQSTQKSEIVALCSKNSVDSENVIRHWSRMSTLNQSHASSKVLLPGDILNLMVKFCSVNGVYVSSYYGDNKDSVNGGKGIWKELDSMKDRNITKMAVAAQNKLFLTEEGEVYGHGETSETYGRPKRTGIGLDRNFGVVDVKINLKLIDGVSDKIEIIGVACGKVHNLLLDSRGRVYSFGLNLYFQCAQKQKAVYGPRLIQYFEDEKERVDHIACGMMHSYCRTMSGKHYLFGGNWYNECCTFNGEHKVQQPFCINGVIAEILNGSRIKSIVLGQQNTRIVMYD